MNGNFLNRMFWGLVLIGVGVVFLLGQMGRFTLDIGYIASTYWPVVLILFGFKGLIEQQKSHASWGSGFAWSLFMIVLGFAFLGRNLGWITLSFGEMVKYLVPVIIIIVGLTMILRPRSKPYDMPQNPEPPRPLEPFEPMRPFEKMEQPPSGGFDHTSQGAAFNEHKNVEKKPHDQVMKKSYNNGWHDWSWNNGRKMENKSNFIGDMHFGGGQEYWELQPMNISTFIGDTVLDLTRAQIPYGETKLTISSFIGDVKIFVPNDIELDVKVTTSAFIGDSIVFDRREGGLFKHVNLESQRYADADKKLRIVVSSFIGDLKVQRVG